MLASSRVVERPGTPCARASGKQQLPRTRIGVRRAPVRSLAVQPIAGKRGALEELANIRREKVADSVPVVTELKWESPLKIVKYPSPILRAPNAKVGVFDDSLKQLAEEMKEIMYQDDGVGLAAPQVGVNIRMMVFNPTGDPDQPEAEMILVNPELISMSDKTETEVEGCLSFRGEGGLEILGDVERAKLVKVRAVDENGTRVKVAYKGWVAKIFQHEFDHLNGVLFPDRFPEDLKAEVKPLLMQLEQAYGEANPGVEYKTIR